MILIYYLTALINDLMALMFYLMALKYRLQHLIYRHYNRIWWPHYIKIEYKHHFMPLMLSYGTDLSSCGLNRLFKGIKILSRDPHVLCCGFKIVSCDLDMLVCCLNLNYSLSLLSHNHNQHVTSEALQ